MAALGSAALTSHLLPSTTRGDSPAAARAAPESTKVTKPKPRERPVARQRMTAASARAPVSGRFFFLGVWLFPLGKKERVSSSAFSFPSSFFLPLVFLSSQ